MEVRIKLLSPLRFPSGAIEEKIECPPTAKILECFHIAEQMLGLEFRRLIFEEGSYSVKSSIAICLKREGLVGVRRIELYDGLETQLNSNDELVIFSPVGGG